MELKEITTRYLTAFESKKLDLLENLFSDKISLRDWEVSAKEKRRYCPRIARFSMSLKI